MRIFIARIAVYLLLVFCGRSTLRSQEPPLATSTTESKPQDNVAELPPPNAASEAYTKKDQKRVFGFMPNYRTTSIDQKTAPSLSVKEKFQLASRDSFDRAVIFSTLTYAGLSQAFGQYPALGGGVQGYGRRVGLTAADSIQGTYLVEAILPSLLHQDPRYFRKGEGSAWSRVGYAFSRIILTRCDSRRLCFNTTEVAGNMASSALSNLYYPSSERTTQNTMVRFETGLTTDVLNNMIREFVPDLVQLMQRRRNKLHKVDPSLPPVAGSSR